MPPEPTLGSISLVIASMKKIYGSYSAYKAGHFLETDQGLRNEILRRVTMFHSHLNNLENQALNARQANIINMIQQIRTNVSAFEQSVRMGISGTSSSNHPQAEKVSKKIVTKLIKLDYMILKKLVNCMNKLNAAQASLHNSPEKTSAFTQELEQGITSVRNRYQERNSYVGELN